MGSSRIDINVNGKDNTRGAFSSTSNSIKKLGQEARAAGDTVGSALAAGATKAAGSMRSLASSASSAFSTIRAGAQAASAELGGLGSAIAGLGGAFSALQIGQMAWTGSTQRQFNEMYLGTKMSTAETKKYLDVISKVVAQVPGDDTWMNSLLTGALAKETSLSTDMLTRLGTAASKYVTAAQQTGASILPANAERELTSYIKSGNTGLMVRDGLLKSHVDELNKAKTPSERIVALEKAMTEEGYLQLNTADLTSSKWEVIKGQVQLAATNVGSKLLPFVEKVLDFIIDLDEKTNGWTSTIGLVAAAIVGVGLALATPLAATVSAAIAMRKYRQDAQAAAVANALNKGAPSPVPLGPAGGKQDARGTGLASSVGGLLVVADLLYGIDQAFKQISYSAEQTNNKFTQASAGLMTFVNSISPIHWLMNALAGVDTSLEGVHTRSQQTTDAIYRGWYDLTHWVTARWNEMVTYLKTAFGGFPAWIGGLWNRIKELWNETVDYLKGAWNNTVAAIRGGFNRITGAARNAWQYVVDKYNWAKGIVQQGIDSVTNFFASGWQSVIDTYNRVKSIVSNAITVVTNFVTGGGPAGPGIAGASGPFDGIGLKYENYQGAKKNAWSAAGNLSGNCVDMSLGLIAAAGTGSLVSGTWNGGPHVWANIGGKNYDPARKALEGTWNPPARGPGGSNVGPAVIIQGDVYGFDDFQAKVEKANNKIMRSTI